MALWCTEHMQPSLDMLPWWMSLHTTHHTASRLRGQAKKEETASVTHCADPCQAVTPMSTLTQLSHFHTSRGTYYSHNGPLGAESARSQSARSRGGRIIWHVCVQPANCDAAPFDSPVHDEDARHASLQAQGQRAGARQARRVSSTAAAAAAGITSMQQQH